MVEFSKNLIRIFCLISKNIENEVEVDIDVQPENWIFVKNRHEEGESFETSYVISEESDFELSESIYEMNDSQSPPLGEQEKFFSKQSENKSINMVRSGYLIDKT